MLTMPDQIPSAWRTVPLAPKRAPELARRMLLGPGVMLLAKAKAAKPMSQAEPGPVIVLSHPNMTIFLDCRQIDLPLRGLFY
jgi:hypothetical protein